MKPLTHIVQKIAIFAGAGFLCGCSYLNLRTSAEAQARKTVERHAPALRVTQLNYGKDAIYALCAMPACPTTTPKSFRRPAGPPDAMHADAVQARYLPPGDSAPFIVPSTPEQNPLPDRDKVYVYFAPGSHALDDAARKALDRAADRARGADQVVISGRTDSSGEEQINQRIARERAANVGAYLRRRMGPADGKMIIDGKGACCYKSDNSSASGRRENRRVEVLLVKHGN